MGFMVIWPSGFEGGQVHVLTGGKDVDTHRSAGGFGVAVLNGDEDSFVVRCGRGLADAADRAQATGDTDLGERIENEPVNQIAARVRNGMMCRDVSLNGGDIVGAFSNCVWMRRIVLICSIVARSAARAAASGSMERRASLSC